MHKIDLKDRKILSALDMDARMPLTQLSKKVGLSRQVVEYRIKRLKKIGVIFGVLPVIDSSVIGQGWYRVLFRLENVNKNKKNNFIKYLQTQNNLFWLGEVGGNWDIVMNVICKNNSEFNLLFEKIFSEQEKIIKDYEILIYVEVSDLERSYLPDTKKQRKIIYHEMKHNPKFQLDEFDKKIIEMLNKDGLTTNVEIANSLNVAANTIKNRLVRMKKNKFLLGFRLFVNPTALGYQSYMLFFELRHFNLQREKELFAYLTQIPEITFLVKHIGQYRIGMEIETKDAKSFQDIFVNIRGKFGDIISKYESFPLFKDHVVNYFPDV